VISKSRVAVGLLGLALLASSLTGVTGSATAMPRTATTSDDQTPCAGSAGVGSPVPAELGPGDLVAATDLTGQYRSSSGFPQRSRAWRILYVSTGVDENDRQLVCGLVAAPKTGPTSTDSRGRILTWAHGTTGVKESCFPSSDPAARFWGKTPSGIGSASWGSLLGAHNGSAHDGPLQHAMDKGWVVTLPDYQPDNYLVGRIAAANVLDSARAATQLMRQEFNAAAPTDYDYLTWGHSQGGHAAMWAGQLAQSYLNGTTPSKPTAALRLVGVALEAPASNFLVQPERQPGVNYGDGLADWDMHESVKMVGLSIAALELQIGPALFSYIFGSWSQLASETSLTPNAAFPAYPTTTEPLALKNIATAKGRTTVARVMSQCLIGAGAKKVKAAVAQYRNAKQNQMLVSPLWNLPKNYKNGDYFKGGLDRTCATTTEPGLVAWCDWLRWNLPGPMGVNPYPKTPMWDGQPVPLLIAQGSNDTVVHCVVADGESSTIVPSAANCMAKALFDSLATEVYCPADTSPKGYLEMIVVRKQALKSPASHLSIPGEFAVRGLARSDLVFSGSPIERFFSGAFDHSLRPSCKNQVINLS